MSFTFGTYIIYSLNIILLCLIPLPVVHACWCVCVCVCVCACTCVCVCGVCVCVCKLINRTLYQYITYYNAYHNFRNLPPLQFN